MKNARIVVGVDGSEQSAKALGWALREARDHGGSVRAIHAWGAPAIDVTPSSLGVGIGPVAPVPYEEIRGAFEQQARQLLDAVVAAALAEVGGKVHVDRELVEEQAAAALTEAAKNADLLVVGTRGLGGFKELLLGSVSHQCVLHAPCPVVVIR